MGMQYPLERDGSSEVSQEGPHSMLVIPPLQHTLPLLPPPLLPSISLQGIGTQVLTFIHPSLSLPSQVGRGEEDRLK